MFYGTRYNADDLADWREVEIQEAIQYAQMMEGTQRNA